LSGRHAGGRRRRAAVAAPAAGRRRPRRIGIERERAEREERRGREKQKFGEGKSGRWIYIRVAGFGREAVEAEEAKEDREKLLRTRIGSKQSWPYDGRSNGWQPLR
jgi:hypothetical protein